MYTDEDIRLAVEAGVLSEESANAFRTHIAYRRGMPLADEEHLRLISGFNDIFVSIACLLFLGSLAWLSFYSIGALGSGIIAASIAWCLSEYFTRKRRMALPSIVLALFFIGTVYGTISAVIGGLLGVSTTLYMIPVLAALVHWLRFKVPITVALGVGSLVLVGYRLCTHSIPILEPWSSLFIFCSGIVVFVIAIRWDISDRPRQTQRSDIAFWLHLLAAPLLAHPIFSYLGVFETGSTLVSAIGVIALYMIFAAVSVVVDRRALMASALIYVMWAGNELLEVSGVEWSFAFTSLVIGLGLLLLTVFWRRCRKFLIDLIPHSIQYYLPPGNSM